MNYRKDGKWGGFEIRESLRGWLVRYWSAVQGNVTNRVTLRPYSQRFPRGMKLDQPWNDWMSNGEALVDLTETIKVVRKGFVVQ
jgi:hypothetical protein